MSADKNQTGVPILQKTHIHCRINNLSTSKVKVGYTQSTFLLIEKLCYQADIPALLKEVLSSIASGYLFSTYLSSLFLS